MTESMASDGFMLAAMVSPALFYAGVGAASVPILIHLFSKRRFRRIRWAAIDFLLEADRRNRRRVRLEEMILLALRCLAMALIGVMVARYFLRPEALMAVLGSPAATTRIIVLDDSFSMGLEDRGAKALSDDNSENNANGDESGAGQLRSRGATVFDRGTAAVARIVRWLRDESPEDPVTIMLASRPDRPLRTGTTVGKIDLGALDDELDALSPSNRGGNMAEALAAARDRLPTEPAANATIYIVSDFQGKDWTGNEGQTAAGTNPSKQGSSPAGELAGWANEQRTLRVVLADVGLAVSDNLCVTAIESEQRQVVAGVSGRFVARVTNFGTSDSDPTSMQVYVGDAARPPVSVPSIGPGETVEVPFENTFAREGSGALTVELANDALPIDDVRACAVQVARTLRVLVVDGEASVEPCEDEVHLLQVALRPEGPQFSGNEITVVDENQLAGEDLASFHVVVLANVFRVSEEIADRLEQYVSQGGGMTLFLGDQVDADPYNRILYRDGAGLLPGRLGEVVVLATDELGIRFAAPDQTHPAMQRFGGTDANYFSGAVAWQYIACEPAGVEQVATAPTSGPASESTDPAKTDPDGRGPARVLLRLEDAEASPLIVERSFGRGRVWLITTSADKEWTNLPDRPVFVLLAIEMVQHLARQDQRNRNQVVGTPIEFPIDLSKHPPQVICKSPAYPEQRPIPIPAKPSRRWLFRASAGHEDDFSSGTVPEGLSRQFADHGLSLSAEAALSVEEGGGAWLISDQEREYLVAKQGDRLEVFDPHGGPPSIRYEQTERPGVYQFDFPESAGENSGETVMERVAVNVAPAESDLRRTDRASLLASLGGIPADYVRGDNLILEQHAESRRELWPAVLIALVVVLMAEQVLAFWFGSERRAGGLRIPKTSVVNR